MPVPSVFLSIRFRIVAAFVAALLVMAGALGSLVSQQSALSRSLRLMSQTYLPLSEIGARLDDTRQRVERDVKRLRNGERRPVPGTLLYTDAFQRNLAQGRQLVAEARALELPAEELATLHQIGTYFDHIDDASRQYQQAANQFTSLSPEQRVDTTRPIFQQLYQNSQTLREETERLTQLLNTHTSTLSAKTERAQSRTVAGAIGASVLAFGFSFALIGAVLHALNPLGRLTEQAQRLAAGDYSGRLDRKGNDEIAVLSREFDNMVQAVQYRDQALVERAQELNRLTRYLTSVLNTMVDGLVVVEQGQVTLANPAAERVWGVAQGQPPPPVLAKRLQQTGRCEVAGADGTLQSIHSAPFGEEGAMLVCTDVTELTNARERLARSERLALVGQMLAQITHEVRNPLNALSLNAELMADELASLDAKHTTEAWQTLGLISKEIDRLTELTGHYLQLARRPPAQFQSEDLEPVLAEVAALFEPELNQHGVQLTLTTEPVGPAWVDANQIRQAVINSVRNAIEAGAHTLRLRLSRVSDKLCIALDDDGPGMNASQRQKALDPFFSTKANGSGLGLAITKQILEDHGGTVAIAKSTLGGASVKLLFPPKPSPHPSAS